MRRKLGHELRTRGPAAVSACEALTSVTLSIVAGLAMLVTALDVWDGIMARTSMLVWPPGALGAETSTARQLKTACRNAE
jgi:hypothetical protein